MGPRRISPMPNSFALSSHNPLRLSDSPRTAFINWLTFNHGHAQWLIVSFAWRDITRLPTVSCNSGSRDLSWRANMRDDRKLERQTVMTFVILDIFVDFCLLFILVIMPVRRGEPDKRPSPLCLA